jgi:ribonuclease P protein component
MSPALFRLDLTHTVRAPSLKAADFQRALGLRPVSRTAHFVLHTLPVLRQGLSTSVEVAAGDARSELSTTQPEVSDALVDELLDLSCLAQVQAWRLGLVLPKKQARRSVTRSLIRHQAREALVRHGPAVRALPAYAAGVDGWVLRLRAPFDKKLFPSAASAALNAVVRQELDELWLRLAAPASAGGRGASKTTGPGPREPRGAA